MLSLKYNITKDLSIMGRSAIDATFNSFQRLYYNDTYTTAIKGGYEKYNNSSYGWNSDALITYKKKLGDIAFDINAGANHYNTEYQQIGGSGRTFNMENFFALGNTADPRPSEAYSHKVVNSVYGFGEISWKNALFLNLTGRNDWSSTLPADNRSYFYPSVGLTAVIDELITLPSAINLLKLRGSYAIVGNDTSPYKLSRTATIITGGALTLSNVLPNANLRPETTKSIEAGFDIRAIEKIRLGFTWYQTNTYDQLFATPVPSTSGVASIFQNGADIQNRGAEITLGAEIISTGDFSWDIDINWAKNTSEVLEIAEGFNVLSYGTDFIREYKLVVGEPFGEVYAKSWLRDANGNVIVAANGVPRITPGMSVPVANFNPDFLAGMTNTLRYKNWNFSVLIDWRQGGTFIAFTEAIRAGSGIQDYTETGRAANSLLFGRDVFPGEKGVTDTGAENTATTNSEVFWNNVGGRNNPAGGAFVREATNMRIREVVLGYDLPKEIVSKTFFRSARFSLVGRNLLFLMNKAEYTDPEIMISTSDNAEGENAFAFPTNRTYGFSLNFGF